MRRGVHVLGSDGCRAARACARIEEASRACTAGECEVHVRRASECDVESSCDMRAASGERDADGGSVSCSRCETPSAESADTY